MNTTEGSARLLDDSMAGFILADYAAFVMTGGRLDQQSAAFHALRPLADQIVAALKTRGYRVVCIDEEPGETP